jgi:hypothetical protein
MSKPVKIKPENEVNAYLFYSQRLLNLLNSTISIEHQGDKMAITAAVCLSLKQAWQSWLKELSAYVGKDIPDYSALSLPENTSHPEIQCLNDINKHANSWLSQLLVFFEPRLNIPTVLDSAAEDGLAVNASSTRINLFQISDEPSGSEIELSEEENLKRVMLEFKAYINSVRSRQAWW